MFKPVVANVVHGERFTLKTYAANLTEPVTS